MKESILLDTIYQQLPALSGQLSVEKIYYNKQNRAVLIMLLSKEPMGEKDFLDIKRHISSILPGLRISLRTAAPTAAEGFLAEPAKYSGIFSSLFARNFPAMLSWVNEIHWLPDKGDIILEMPDEFSMGYMKENGLQKITETAIYDIFRIRPAVSFGLRNDAQQRLERIEKSRAKEEERKKERLMKQDQMQQAQPEGKKGSSSLRIKGSVIKDSPVGIGTLNELSGTVTIQGKVVSKERKDLPGKEMVLLTFVVNDASGSIKCKIFLRYRGWSKRKDEEAVPLTREEIDAVEKVINAVKENEGIKVRGNCERDSFEKDIVLMAKDMMHYTIEKRADHSERKRIELHAHTHMSNMDATVSASDLIKQAARWGHPAIAVTDSGVVQAFPEAFMAAQKNKIKLIPGLEGYMIDGGGIVNNPDNQDLEAPIIVVDFETTGLNSRDDRIIEIGAVKIENGAIVDTFSSMVNPGRPLPSEIVRITGITDQMVMDAPTAEQILPELMTFMGSHTIAAHNAKFDCAFLANELKRIRLTHDVPQLDTLSMAQKMFPELKSFRLASVCKHLGVSLKNAHRAVHDATATAKCLNIMLRELKDKGATTLQEIDTILTGYVKTNRRHVVLLACSQQGMFNLNKLVTMSHLEYFNRVPAIPRDMIEKHREGLLIGSACEEGEVFQAVLEKESDAKLEKIISFYDYLEVQPLNNHILLKTQGLVRDDEELRAINNRIISLGEKLKKPVVATGDVHFLEPEDSIFRSILQFSQNVRNHDVQPDLYFKTTDEMLEEFAYLGKEKAEEIVIDNPAIILSRIGDISLYPKHPENKTTFAPVWDTAEEDIRSMAMGKAHALYGDTLPQIIQDRLKKELDAIIGYGYATLYSIANKLVQNSLTNGYVVGSRGSVGSSFVATMCGITEVNPLPPHYRCPGCRKAWFDVPSEYKTGVDLPEKACDTCGGQLVKDGFDIPFEVFLGFKGDKVPDIDLNFSGDYQAQAHAYVEELFGAGYVFRAGTIGTLQSKTAYGHVMTYLRENEKEVSNTEVDRLVQGCVGVKRTTGQHPGGMVILPKEYDIAQFTAVQHPADKDAKGIITTHYDFNSMHDILVKLDILGHDDPTIIHMLERLTGVHYADIPLDDPKVMSLFVSPEALGVTAREIGCETGTLGVPEFGTPFVRQMLMDTKPTTMAELVRISGLSHGTDVWLGNAKDLILNGTAVLKECICIRDDIMNYLISMGMPAKAAFDIMENVRKGKKLAPGQDMENAMKEHNVPGWFIESCKKIGYLFPKGHAVAYVTMALRIAWFKVYHPLEYYAAYFTIRAKGFDAETMLCPPQYVRKLLEDLQESDIKEQTGSDKDEIVALEVVLEMLARGFTFLPVDLYRSQVKEFTIEGNALRCPFTSLKGFGEQAAISIVEERKQPFLSTEDLKKRTRITNTGIEMLRKCGTMEDLSDTNQLSFF